MNEEPAYGLWSLVVINSLVFITFAYSFSKPRTQRALGWFSGLSAFLVALFVEKYGFPLTIYILSDWLFIFHSGEDFLTHNAGHLWNNLFGLQIQPRFDPMHILSNVIIVCGFIFLSAAWKELHEAQVADKLALTGVYAYVRHPQYDGFILIMVGFLLQWPTLITIVMFPILVGRFIKLAHQEDYQLVKKFGRPSLIYLSRTPGFFPYLFRKAIPV